jgi:hypothetical protein
LWEVDCKKYVKGKDNFRKFPHASRAEMRDPDCSTSALTCGNRARGRQPVC